METCEIYPPISSTGKNIKEYFRTTLPGHIYQNLPFLFFIYMLVLTMCFIYMLVLTIC